MKRNDLAIHITLSGPLLTQSSEPGDFGLDIVVAKTGNGDPYIPGTLLMGKLAQAWQEISGAVNSHPSFAPDTERWLGKTSKNNIPIRKQLFFSDLVLKESLTDDFVHHRVTIDEQRGAASRQQLASIESPFLQGKEYVFNGTIIFFASQEDSIAIEKYVKTGLRWLPQLGAMRTIGYGRVQSITFPSPKNVSIPSPAAPVIIPDKIWLKIQPEYPFCLSKTSVADNLFESTDIIPGSVLIGSIMTTWNCLTANQSGTASDISDNSRQELKDNFNALRITHAFPSDESHKRPVVYPKSLVKIFQDDNFYDVASCEKPCLIKGKVPAFSIDWKDDSDVAKAFGWTPVPRELRIRTGIDPDRLRSAENELFSFEQVIPDKHSWYAELDLGSIEETQQEIVLSQLRSLLSQGMIGLGKTKTPATVEFILSPAQITPTRSFDPKPVNTNQWIITLQSDTLLGSPETMDETSGVDALRKMYETAWQELSDNKLHLIRYFASQRLTGGIWRRKTMQKGHLYRPWLLTEAGSVFVLEAGGNISDARLVIEKWLQHGLPLKRAVLEYYRLGSDPSTFWQSCPYIPENGFGEITVNLNVHTNAFPPNCTYIDVLEEEGTNHGA